MINASDGDFYIKMCHEVEVHVTEKTMGSVVSDVLVCYLNLFMAAISICSNSLVINVYVKVRKLN